MIPEPNQINEAISPRDEITVPCFSLFSSRVKGDYVRYNGYTFCGHLVTTQDEVLLQMHRIQNQRAFVANQSVPVLLLPGVMTSSFDFIANLPHQSLGFFLADMGYDVFLGNFRATKYGSMSYATHPNIYNAT